MATVKKDKVVPEAPADNIANGATPDNGSNEEFDFSAITVAVAPELPKASRDAKPNPMTPIVAKSVEANFQAMQYGPIPQNLEARAKTLMHRAARDAGHGLNIRTTPGETEGTVVLIFKAKESKRAFKYTTEEVRTWAESTYDKDELIKAGYDRTKRIPAGVLTAYRQAHDIDS